MPWRRCAGRLSFNVDMVEAVHESFDYRSPAHKPSRCRPSRWRRFLTTTAWTCCDLLKMDIEGGEYAILREVDA